MVMQYEEKQELSSFQGKYIKKENTREGDFIYGQLKKIRRGTFKEKPTLALIFETTVPFKSKSGEVELEVGEEFSISQATINSLYEEGAIREGGHYKLSHNGFKVSSNGKYVLWVVTELSLISERVTEISAGTQSSAVQQTQQDEIPWE